MEIFFSEDLKDLNPLQITVFNQTIGDLSLQNITFDTFRDSTLSNISNLTEISEIEKTDLLRLLYIKPDILQNEFLRLNSELNFNPFKRELAEHLVLSSFDNGLFGFEGDDIPSAEFNMILYNVLQNYTVEEIINEIHDSFDQIVFFCEYDGLIVEDIPIVNEADIIDLTVNNILKNIPAPVHQDTENNTTQDKQVLIEHICSSLSIDSPSLYNFYAKIFENLEIIELIDYIETKLYQKIFISEYGDITITDN
jgi:hypothetical protein